MLFRNLMFVQIHLKEEMPTQSTYQILTPYPVKGFLMKTCSERIGLINRIIGHCFFSIEGVAAGKGYQEFTYSLHREGER